jgi:hypothetical protein
MTLVCIQNPPQILQFCPALNLKLLFFHRLLAMMVILGLVCSDVQAWLVSARPDEGLGESKPEPQALKSLSRPKPWA